MSTDRPVSTSAPAALVNHEAGTSSEFARGAWRLSPEGCSALETLHDAGLAGSAYREDLLSLIDAVVAGRSDVEEAILVFNQARGFSRDEEIAGLTMDPAYAAIVKGQSALTSLDTPYCVLAGGLVSEEREHPHPAAFSELSYFTTCPVSYRLRLAGEALATIAACSRSEADCALCMDALGHALNSPEQGLGSCEIGATGLALIAASDHAVYAVRSKARSKLKGALKASNTTIRHYAVQGLHLASSLRPQEAPRLSQPTPATHARQGSSSTSCEIPTEARSRIEVLRASASCSCLVLHNIREALGDEWIRNGLLVASLLNISPGTTVTVITEKPFLYNHPRLRPLGIHSAEGRAALDARYDIVFDQRYRDGAYDPSLSNRCSDGSPALTFLSAESSNYYDPCPRAVSIDGRSAEALPRRSQPANVYQQTAEFVASLGLGASREDVARVLLSTVADPEQEALVYHRKAAVDAETVTIFNPFGGTFEEKGFTRNEADEIVAEIRRLIECRSLIVVTAASPWGSTEVVQQILVRLSPEEREHVLVSPVSRAAPQHSLLALLRLADRVVSVEGGFTHLALAAPLPVEILRRKGSSPFLMWLPFDRLPGQCERTLVWEFSNGRSEGHQVSLRRAVREYVEGYRQRLQSTEAELLGFLLNPERLSPCIVPRASLSTAEHDDLVRGFIPRLPRQGALAAFRAKWTLPSRIEAVRTFLSRPGEDPPRRVTLAAFKDMNSGRARTPGHFVYRLDFDVDGDLRSLYCKGHPRPEVCPVRRFPGWDNRPLFHLYESFFWRACSLTGLAERRSIFFPDSLDGHAIGYTLTEAIPGEQSDGLVRQCFEGRRIPELFDRHIVTLGTQLGRWCALMELLRGGDRRVASISSEYQRPSNYLVACPVTGPFVTGIDHELLFCKEPCISYDRLHGASEGALLDAVPNYAKAAFTRAFSRAFLEFWRGLTSPAMSASLERSIRTTFWPGSEEQRVYQASRAREGEEVLGEILCTTVWGSANPNPLPLVRRYS